MKRLFAALVLLSSLLLPATAFAAATSTATSTPTSASPKVVQSPTCALFAAGNSVKVGNTVNLSWTSSNATEGTISTIGSVGPSGTQGVIPLPPSTTYVGQFAGPGGNATCSITIGVGASGYYTFDTGMPDYAAPGTSAPGPLNIPTNAPQSFTQSGGTVGGGGIVQCTGAADCNLCTFGKTFQKLLNFLVGLTIPLAAIAFAFAGWLYFSNADNPGQIERGKKIFKNVLIGFIVVLMAWLMIQTILKTVAPGYQSWNNWDCSNHRPMNSNLGQVVDNALGRPQAAPSAEGAPQAGTSQPGAGILCKNSSHYSATIGGCLDNTTGECAYADCGVSPTMCGNTAHYDAAAGTCLDNTTGECAFANCALSDGLTPLADNSGACDPDAISAAAAANGDRLDQSGANFLACVAKPESTCGTNIMGARTRNGTPSSAVGAFQVVVSTNAACMERNPCTQAAQTANYNVSSGDLLNCRTAVYQGRPTGKYASMSPSDPNNLGQACITAAANFNCQVSAASCLLNKNPGGGDWTGVTDGLNHNGQQACTALLQ